MAITLSILCLHAHAEMSVPPFLVSAAKAQEAYSKEVQTIEKSGRPISSAEKVALKEKYFSSINHLAAVDTSAAQTKASKAAQSLQKSDLTEQQEINSAAATSNSNNAFNEPALDVSTVSEKKKSARTPSSTKNSAERLTTTSSQNVETGGPETISFSSH